MTSRRTRPSRRPALARGRRRTRAGHRLQPSRPAGRDHGSTLVVVAIFWPVFLTLLLLVVQLVMLWHARHVAEAAARDGLRAARGYDAPADAGTTAATAYLRQVAPRLITDPTVTTTTDHDPTGPVMITVRVRGHASSVMTWLDLRIDAHASGPREAFTPPSATTPARSTTAQTP